MAQELSDAEVFGGTAGQVWAEAQRQGVDPTLATNVARQESRFNPNARSPAGAIGTMQLMPATAAGLGVDPNNPDQNIEGGVRYLGQQVKDFGDPRLAAAAYNAGPGRVRRAGDVPNIRETQNYVAAVVPGGPSNGEMSDAEVFGAGSATPAPGPQADPRTPRPVFNPEPGGKPYNDAQQAAYARLMTEGQFNEGAPVGSRMFPRGMIEGRQPAVGEWYVDLDGSVKQAPGLGEDLASSAASGARQAAADFSGMNPASLAMQLTNKQLSDVANVVSMIPGVDRTTIPQVIRRGAQFAHDLDPATPIAEKAYGPEAYRPKTDAGKFVQTGVHMLPNAALGAGGAAQRAANVVLPTIGSEAARIGAREAGGGELAQELAAGAGGVVGGLVGGTRFGRPAQEAPEAIVTRLETDKRAAYDAVDAAGFRFNQQQLRDLHNNLNAQVRARGGPRAALASPQADSILGRIDALARQPGGATLSQLDEVRRDIYPLMMEGGGPDTFYGGLLRSGIDQLTDSVNAPGIREARAANTRWAKADEVQRRRDSARLQAGRSHSGENVENPIRQKLSPMIDPMHSGEVQNLTPPERAAIDRIVVGDDDQNGLRRWEKRLRNPLWTGPIMTVAAGLGAKIGGPAGAASVAATVPVVMQGLGQHLRGVAERRVGQNVDDLIRLIANGGTIVPQVARTPRLSHQANFPALVAAGPAMQQLLVPQIAHAEPPARKEPRGSQPRRKERQ